MRTLQSLHLENKTVLLRTDYNVPLQHGKVASNWRIKATLPTIGYLLKKNCKIVIATHLGRPEGRKAHSLTLGPIAKELQRLLKRKVHKLNDCIGKDIRTAVQKGNQGDIFMLENLRFYKEEENNNPIFAHSLAALADAYVNDAFAVAHRKHASVHPITKFLPSAAGLLMQKEAAALRKALHPHPPAVWIIGGAKLDKIDLFRQALKKADYILVGGALAFSFLKAKGVPVGMSRIDIASVEAARSILKQRGAEKIILPCDFLAADKFSSSATAQRVRYYQLQGLMGLDIGTETIETFKQYLRKGHTIVWNGPVGYFEWARFAAGTRELARFMGKLTAYSVAGGGETAEALEKFHCLHNFSHVSTGGGAAVAFLSGKRLPGLEVLS